MKLKTACITNFRSVEDSGEFEIDDRVTCLVGKNEAGKSAILTALAALNPHPVTPVVLNRVEDYPRRHLTKYDERHPDGEAVVVLTTWELDASDRKLVSEQFGAGALTSDLVAATRSYGDTDFELIVETDEKKSLAHLYDVHKLGKDERGSMKQIDSWKAAVGVLEKVEASSEPQKALLAALKLQGSIDAAIRKLLKPRMPRMMYFSAYDQMAGEASVEQDLNDPKTPALKLFQEFFDFAGVPIKEVVAEKNYEPFNAKLEAGSNSITDQIKEYWTQNPDLEVRVKVEVARAGDAAPRNSGTVARARIYNSLHRVETPFSNRSAGFVWFFSFLVKFELVKKSGVPIVLLLDEPGLTLHGKAQAELLRFFDEKLAPHHQVVYSTHSPFMVASDRILSARIVEDQVDQKGKQRIPIGTKVRGDVMSRDRDTLFPLQGALGYEITQTLFVGKNTLLVEGPGDMIYLRALSSALAKKKRTCLDPRWTLCPCGGLGNVRSFVALFGGNKINVSVLADYADGQKKETQRLRELEIFRSGGGVLTMDTFAGKTEADTEDLFEPAFFAELLNSTYGLKGASALTDKKLDAADTSTVRLIKKAEAYFRTGATASIEVPDLHYRPAEWLMLNPNVLDQDRADVQKTLERAEQLMIAINKLLPKD